MRHRKAVFAIATAILLVGCRADYVVAPTPFEARPSFNGSGGGTSTFFLHGTGNTANPAVLTFDQAAPTGTIAKYKDSPSVNFAGGNAWKTVGEWTASPATVSGELSALADAHLWLGLKNSDDIGTRFDVRVELLKNGTTIATGMVRCIQGITRNPNLALDAAIPFDAFASVAFNGTSDVPSLRVSTRVGTTSSNTHCGGHSNAVGLRVYFDATTRPAGFGAGYADPEQIVFTRDNGGEDIFIMDADGSNVVQLTNSAGIDNTPVWSPDKSRIAFTSARAGSLDIWVMNPDGTGLVQLTTNSGRDALPSWSPDGSQIAFESNRDGQLEIYVMNADGTAQTNISNNGAVDYWAQWSPDGSRIAFTSSRGGNQDVWVMNPDGSDPVQLTTAGDIDYAVAWSPDGTKIAFSSERFDGEEEVMLMNADGTNQVRLTDSGGINFYPVFSPDGARILFSSTRLGAFALFVMNVDGSNVFQLTAADGSYTGSWR